ncbi:MAG: hypothetical protein JWR62_2539 [Modestobacter sp.]|nr:hypothetical protein [Modestobacter sp.]
MSQTTAVPAGTDPRPRVVVRGDDAVVAGVRCTECGHPVAFVRPRCPACRGPVEPAEFGPAGTAWSSTVVRIPVPGREPPYALAYLDLDDGPRVLAHLPGDRAVPVGTRLRLTAPDEAGDLTAEEA